MNVTQSLIYGLLGPSGCGKTTLLRCIVGRLKPICGSIKVFGTIPGTKNACIPGPGVGYMPQLCIRDSQFMKYSTISQLLMVFIAEKLSPELNFLITFLNLPAANKLISNLSGGQKRRVSLAAALVHNPPLLILDEPTVGVDPLLRERIWDHLISLTRTERMTIIITTHYVEEAKRAHLIGFMRESCLLLEQKPMDVLSRYNVTNLEEAFLKLSQTQQINDSYLNQNPIKNENLTKNKLFEVYTKPEDLIIRSDSGEIEIIDQKRDENVECLDIKRMKALFNKNFIFLKRNVIALIFALILPAIQMLIFCTCIGNEPKIIKIGVYDFSRELNDTDFESIGHRIIHNYTNKIGSERLKATYYSSAEEAINSVRSGTNWAALVFGEYFAESLIDRINAEPFYSIDDEVIEDSTVKLYADMTNFLVIESMFRELSEMVNTFAYESLSILPGANHNSIKNIIELQEPPIYGTKNPNFKTYTASGVILTLAFMMALLLTTLIFVNERKEGQFERCLIAGIKAYQIFVAYVSLQLVVMLTQVVLLLLTAFVIFSIPISGSYALVIALTLLQGIGGTCAGFFISAICDEEQTAFIVAFGSFFASLLLSGVFWPLESMPDIIRYSSYSLPQTLAVESFRAITLRGWGLEYFDVWIGFISTIVWIIIYVCGTILTISYKT